MTPAVSSNMYIHHDYMETILVCKILIIRLTLTYIQITRVLEEVARGATGAWRLW